MKIHWTALLVGVGAGALLGWMAGRQAHGPSGSASATTAGGRVKITGSFAAPFQAFIDKAGWRQK